MFKKIKKAFRKLQTHFRAWNDWRRKNLNPWWFKLKVLILGKKASPSYRAYRITHDSWFYSDYDAAVKFWERRDI